MASTRAVCLVYVTWQAALTFPKLLVILHLRGEPDGPPARLSPDVHGCFNTDLLNELSGIIQRNPTTSEPFPLLVTAPAKNLPAAIKSLLLGVRGATGDMSIAEMDRVRGRSMEGLDTRFSSACVISMFI